MNSFYLSASFYAVFPFFPELKSRIHYKQKGTTTQTLTGLLQEAAIVDGDDLKFNNQEAFCCPYMRLKPSPYWCKNIEY